MVEKTHVATSIGMSAAFASIIAYPFSICFVAGVTLGSILPDIDHPKSFISRHSFGLGKVIHKRFGHRGATHSLITWFVLFIFFMLFIPNSFTLGVSLGYLLHIIEDFFSVSGVPLYLPFDRKRRKCPVYRTTGREERLIYICALLFITFILMIDKNLLRTFIQSAYNLIS
ncbi:MAG: hypothetical protein K0R71_853 [Bacillales bacterium]|nr:hypothetical protein [Bacillales bacterium]